MSNVNWPKRGFTTIQNKVLRDERLHWKTRGIFCYIYSQSRDWNFYVTEVVKHAPDGKDALLSGLRELEQYGYLKRSRVRDSDGQLHGTHWDINDSPDEELPAEPKPVEENPHEANPPLRSTNNKNYQQQEIITKEDTLSGKPDRAVWKDVLMWLNQSAARSFKYTASNQRLIEARLKEGFTYEDCVKVIDNKVADWRDDPKMSQYLRPKTLFNASNFEGYLNETTHEEVKGYGGLDF